MMKTLKELKRFYIVLFAIIFISSQLFLNVFVIRYVEKLLIKQRLEQNQQLVRMALDTVRAAKLRRDDEGSFRTLLHELVSKTFFNRESFVCVIDVDGFILAHLDPERIGLYRGNQQIQTDAGPRPFSGHPELTEGIWDNQAFSKVEIVSTLFDEELGITVAAHQNRAVVDQSLRTVRTYFSAFSVAILAVFFGAGWVVTRRMVGRYVRQIERYESELEAFNYSVSHDLKAPLRAIHGFGEALLVDSADRLDDRGRGHLERLRAATKRMRGLIDDLLRLSKVSRKDLRRVEVDLSAIATEIAVELAQKEPDRRVSFIAPPGIKANGDAGLLRIVLENLISNAWKYTSKKLDARVELGVTDVEGERAYFVRDNGVGFDPSYVDKLFTPFQRVHSAEDFEGSGIGLATVQRIVHRHGGGVWAQGEIDKGATISFSLD